MSVNPSKGHSKLTTKEMLKMFGPIILFSIILPSIDIITDIRMVIILATQKIYSCKPSLHTDYGSNITSDEYARCRFSEDLDSFCKLYPNLCKLDLHTKFATLLVGM